MENPEPVREHRALEKLAGHFSGPERMHPSYFNESERKGRAVTDARVALDGFAVVQDYEQELEDGTHFAGHGVFRYDMASDTYEMHWFDSTGGPERVFRGGFADNKLVMTARAGEGWQRLSYDFKLEGGYRFRLETSEDGTNWNVALEGDNFVEQRKPARQQATTTTREGASAASRQGATSKATGKKAAARKTASSKAAGRKTTGKNKASGKTAARATPKKKAVAGKKTANKAAKKTAAGRKSSAKKATGKKQAAARPAAKKKASARKKSSAGRTSKKAAAQKTSAKKAAGKKASSKKASSKKASSKKASGKKAAKKAAKKAGAKVRVSAVERDRRQGKASKKIGAKKQATAGAATRRAVSQKKTESSAQEGPRMPHLKKTSTRVGWHKTAAKGKREN